MKTCIIALGLFVSSGIVGLPAAHATSACNGPNGSLFNLEPRTNAVVQVARSVAFLSGGAGNGNDLVVATATDERGDSTNPQADLESKDAFYIQRSNANCTPDSEGGEPGLNTAIDSFAPDGTGAPAIVADSQRQVFFIADIMFGGNTLDHAVGIVRTTSATLQNTTSCPNGTMGGTGNCWPIGNVASVSPLNSFLFHPQIAVDSRANGTGAGDVYAVVTQNDAQNSNPTISLTACTNGMNCGNAITISGTDHAADFAWVSVRPDGIVTVSYTNTNATGTSAEIKFVSCTPNGAPNAPTCSAPLLVTTEKNSPASALIGDVNMTDVLFPRHASRLEADGKTVTTFLVYDRCDVALVKGLAPVCSKTDVVFTSSDNDGASWSPLTKVSTSVGQQFFGTIANDASTETINIAYYSTESDPFQQRPQVFLAQITPGTTTIGGTHQLTSAAADVQATPPLSFSLQPVAFGDRIGLAAAGTGQTGQSHAYVTYTWNSVPGIYNGASSPDVNNHLVLFQY